MEDNKLIVIKQLPVIEEKLKSLSDEITVKVTNARALVCTEETVKAVKEVRANLNKDFKELEQQRKTVKEKVLAPYLQFEEIYKEYVSDKFNSADTELKSKVDAVESELKLKKEQEIKNYFEEYKTANNIDFVTYVQAKVNVTLTASMKSLKEQAKAFIDKIVDDLNLIETQEHKSEILVEYKQTLNVSNAITTVANRFKAIEMEKARQEEIKRRQLEEAQKIACESIKAQTEATQEALSNFIIEEVRKPLEKPVVEENQEEILTLKFTVKSTRTKLKQLKEFLESGGYDYE